jgi:flagellar motor switch protein FliN/FliY
MAFSRQDWIDRFAGELSSAVGAMAGGDATPTPGGEGPSNGWTVTLQVEAGGRGELSVEFDRTASQTLARTAMGMDEEPPDDMVVDALRELCAQAAGSMVLAAPLAGVRLTVSGVAPAAAAAAAAAEETILQVRSETGIALPIRIWGDAQLSESPRATVPAPILAAVPAPRAAAAPAETPKLDVILDIDLPLTVRFGRTEMPLRSVATLGPGSVIDLGRSPDDPVDVLVSNQLVARGEVVIVAGNYGVRITDVFNPENGIRGLEDRFR